MRGDYKFLTKAFIACTVFGARPLLGTIRLSASSASFFLFKICLLPVLKCGAQSLKYPFQSERPVVQVLGPMWLKGSYAVVYSLNLKRPSQELQNSSHGLGMISRSHLGIAPAYMVVLKELNMRFSASM